MVINGALLIYRQNKGQNVCLLCKDITYSIMAMGKGKGKREKSKTQKRINSEFERKEKY